MSERVTTRAFSALRWGYAGFLARAIASFASGVVLARLLGPKPFGQLAAATLVFGLANQLSDGGFSSALVQTQELDETDVRFAFTCQLIIGAILAGVCISVAPLLGTIMRDPVIGDVVRATSVVFLIQAFCQSSAAMLKRRLAFRELQTAQVVSSVTGYGLVGISAAWLGAGVWSLVAAQVGQSLIYASLVFIQARHSLAPCWKASGIRLARFGVKVAGANILNWSITNLDNAFIGRAFGSITLGLYSRAFNTVSTPTDAVVSTWQQVLFSSCSRVSDRAQVLRRAYLASLSAVALIMFPVFWSVAACASVVIAALYGPRWAAAAPLLAPLAIAISLHAVMAMAGPILTATDKVTVEVRRQALSLVVAICAFGVCARYSSVLLAWAVLGVYSFRFIAMTQPVLRLLCLRWTDVMRVLQGPIIAASLTAVVVRMVALAANLHSVRSGWALVSLVLAGFGTISTLLLLAADRILSRELVVTSMQLDGFLPTRLSRCLRAINAKQAVRENPQQISSCEPLPQEATTR